MSHYSLIPAPRNLLLCNRKAGNQMNKRLQALALSAAMVISMTACGSKGGSVSKANKNVTITIFNSKTEIADQMKELASEYEKASGVRVKVDSPDETVSLHLATRYVANDPYTISMVDAKDIYTLAADHAADLSKEKWVDDTKQAISVKGKVYGFPFCMEGRGIIYNASAIKKVTGKDFDPSSVQTLDEFKSLLEELKKKGMKSPVGIQAEDWSLGAHFFPQIYEEQEDTDSFIEKLHKGTADIASDKKFDSIMDTFDVLMKYNYASADPLKADRETTERMLAEGDIAFMFGGTWDWSLLEKYNPSDEMGLMPIPQNTDDGTNTKLVAGSTKYLFIDNSDAISDKERQAAKDFLNWLVYDKAGQQFITKTCGLVSPFTNNSVDAADPLGKSLKQYLKDDKLIGWYNFLPDDQQATVGAMTQQYLGKKIDRAQFAGQIESYWKNARLSTIR